MRRQQALQIVRREPAVTAVPWWQARWLVTTGKVVWWLLTFAEQLAVAVVAVALVIIGAVLIGMGVMGHFVQGPPPVVGRKGGFFDD
jgi:hypothetical protein